MRETIDFQKYIHIVLYSYGFILEVIISRNSNPTERANLFSYTLDQPNHLNIQRIRPKVAILEEILQWLIKHRLKMLQSKMELK